MEDKGNKSESSVNFDPSTRVEKVDIDEAMDATDAANDGFV